MPSNLWRCRALLLALIILIANVSAQRKGAARGNVEEITAAQLKAYLSFIASDELEGRDTPSRGLNIAAQFLAAQLARWGVMPGGEGGTYFQTIKLSHVKIDPQATFAELNGKRFQYGEDFLAKEIAANVSGALVYVGQCWTIAADSIFADESLEVRGKIILTHAGFPQGLRFGSEEWESPSGYAKRRGAKAIVYIPTFQTLSNWPRTRQSAIATGEVFVDKFAEAEGAAVPNLTASAQMLTEIFRNEAENAQTIFKRGVTGETGRAFALEANKTISFTVALKTKPEITKNVIGVLEGGDGKLKKEYVALGAHYDHVGIGRPAAGDSIYNGADDDGSGTAAVLAIAEAFAQSPRPKRSILFVWHTGEEQGLWGSKYFTSYPTVPLEQIIAQLNMDMIGRSKKPEDANPANAELSGPNEVYVIGAKMMSTQLAELSERVNKNFLNLAFNYRYDKPDDPNQFFYRSDHFHYAQKGVPIIFYFDGIHEDYHKPSDSVDKIDFVKMEKVARTIFATAWELANVPQRPVVDKPLPAELTNVH
jgi:Zn-dependent M28 family amino/carboxypeptidase